MIRNLKSVTLLALGGVAAAMAADGKRPIAETDLYGFQWIAHAQISPDGSRVIYTHVRVTPKHDDYETALWMVPAEGGAARQLTSGPRDSDAQWSPDGSRVAFTRSVEKDGKPQPPQIWILPMDGGEARPLTDLPKGASGFVWAPDGRAIAFNSTTLAKDLEKKKDGEEVSDVRVIAKAVYRSNGAGFVESGRAAHIWTVEIPAAGTAQRSARQITSGEFAETDLTWSRDGSRIYFVSNRVKEPYYEAADGDIYAVSASGGEIVKIASIDGPIRQLSLSADGAHLAFVGSLNRDGAGVERSYSQSDLFVTRVEPGSTPRSLTADYDYDIAGGVGGDQAPPRGGGGSKPFWSADGRSIFVTAGEEGRVNLKRIDAGTGKVEAVTTGAHDIFSVSATPDAAKLALLVSTPTNIGDLFVADGKTGAMRQVTRINGELFSKLDLTEPETIWYQSFDRRRIQAWVQRPPDFQEGKRYPLILNIHGGPHAAYGYTFDHEIQWMAAKGYVVLYPNPRGSTTYGQDFGNVIQYSYPGDDYKDLMAGVDALIARGWVDPEKLAVTGGSGGGVLTNWVIGHTARFKAAVSQRSIADWTGFWYTADFTLFTPTWFRGAPWDQEADFKARSPITYIKNVTTPLMLIEGEADLRTPPADGGEQMFRALKFLRKPVIMVRFPGESHELSRSGKPTHRVERLHHIVAWFDKYLMGRDTGEYEVQ